MTSGEREIFPEDEWLALEGTEASELIAGIGRLVKAGKVHNLKPYEVTPSTLKAAFSASESPNLPRFYIRSSEYKYPEWKFFGDPQGVGDEQGATARLVTVYAEGLTDIHPRVKAQVSINFLNDGYGLGNRNENSAYNIVNTLRNRLAKIQKDQTEQSVTGVKNAFDSLK